MKLNILSSSIILSSLLSHGINSNEIATILPVENHDGKKVENTLHQSISLTINSKSDVDSFVKIYTKDGVFYPPKSISLGFDTNANFENVLEGFALFNDLFKDIKNEKNHWKTKIMLKITFTERPAGHTAKLLELFEPNIEKIRLYIKMIGKNITKESFKKVLLGVKNVERLYEEEKNKEEKK